MTRTFNKILAVVVPLATCVAGCGDPVVNLDTTAPTVFSIVPTDEELGVATNRDITATFSELMDPETIDDASFTLTQGGIPVSAVVSYTGTVATLNPTNDLAINSVFIATIITTATDQAGNPLAVNEVWSFTTGATTAAGPAPVNLGTSGNFVILAKSGVDTVPTSAVVGDIGVSPIDSTAITGFSLIADATNVFSISSQVTGRIFAPDFAQPTPSNLTTAVSDMETAFTDAAGRAIPDFTELGAGDVSGLTLVPGLYKWGTGLLISTDITLAGGPNDVWIFQIAGGITQAPGARINLSGGAQAKNIFWQTFGAVAIDTTAHMEGIILSQTEITLATGASINGRLLAQTAVNIDASAVVEP